MNDDLRSANPGGLLAQMPGSGDEFVPVDFMGFRDEEDGSRTVLFGKDGVCRAEAEDSPAIRWE